MGRLWRRFAVGFVAVGGLALFLPFSANVASADSAQGVWHATTAPLSGLSPPAGSHPAVSLASTSCPAPGWCVSAGSYTDSSGNEQYVLETLSNGNWTAVTAPLPPGGSVNGAPFGTPTPANSKPAQIGVAFRAIGLRVFCPAEDSCVAVGSYVDASGNGQGLIETLSGGTWTPTTAPTDTLSPPTNTNPSVTLNAVTCAGVGSCVAVGNYQDSHSETTALMETLSGGTWTAATADSFDTVPLGYESLDAVSCPTATSCVAVGNFTDSSGNLQGLIETLNPMTGGWDPSEAPTSGLDPATNTNPQIQLNALSCPSSGTCVAVGTYQDSSANLQGLIETLSGGNWTALTAPTTGLSPAAGTAPGVSLNAVSCPATGSCVAVGGYGDTSDNRQGLLETLSGGSWTALTAPTSGLNPTPNADPGIGLFAVSCSSAGSCVAVGDYDNAATFAAPSVGVLGAPTEGLIEMLSSGTWTALTAPTSGLSPAVNSTTPNVGLSDVSCARADACVASGSYFDSSDTEQGLLEELSPPPSSSAYWTVARDGGIFAFGGAPFYGSMGGKHLNRPVVGMAADPVTGGYWEVASDGGIFAFHAPFFGSTGNLHLNRPVVGMAPTADGGGYWLVASDGGVFAFGDATYYGSMGDQHLNQPVVGMDGDPATGGYWLVAADGGVFAFNAPFLGSTGGMSLTKPVVGISAMPDGGGYRFVAGDGGIFAFGDVGFFGSEGGKPLNAAMVGMATADLGAGYWTVASDGGIFAFGSAVFSGSMGGKPLNAPMVGMARA